MVKFSKKNKKKDLQKVSKRVVILRTNEHTYIREVDLVKGLVFVSFFYHKANVMGLCHI